MNQTIKQLYFDWLCELVKIEEQTLYWNDILYALYTSEFVVVHPKDANRIGDAMELRNDFRGIFGPCRGMYEPANVLEVLIALARRGEWEIMHDPDLGDRTHLWFWTMIYNLGLEKYAYRGALNAPDIDEKVFKIIENFVERGYGRDGNGSIFLDKSGQVNFKKEELWNQMCFYFDQFF